MENFRRGTFFANWNTCVKEVSYCCNAGRLGSPLLLWPLFCKELDDPTVDSSWVKRSYSCKFAGSMWLCSLGGKQCAARTRNWEKWKRNGLCGKNKSHFGVFSGMLITAMYKCYVSTGRIVILLVKVTSVRWISLGKKHVPSGEIFQVGT